VPRTVDRFALILPLAIIVALGAPASAQPDTTANVPPADSSIAAEDASTPTDRDLPTPGTALRRSLLVPGWGQIYNRDYIKAGLAVGAVGGLTALAVTYGLRTVLYRRAAIYADCVVAPVTVPEGTCDDAESFGDEYAEAGSLTGAQNRLLRDNSRRNRDFLILMTGMAYALQVLDAYVSAHLASFDVSEDLSLRLTPTPSGPVAALRWTF
jgi:hypothetical protein